MIENFDYDVAIIGGGSGGYAAARTAAAAGLRTVVIEGGEEVGGLCILRGCMPTKALLYASEVMHLSKHAEVWGIRNEKTTYDFREVMARKDRLIQEFAEYRRQQLTDGRFEFIRATAKFESLHTLALSNGRKLTAKNFVISTGSVVAPPPVHYLEKINYLTSDEALKLSKLPKSLIVLGGGAIAVEFAQFFQRFGVEVKLVQRSAHILRDFDVDAAKALEVVFQREGMEVYSATRLTDAWEKGGTKGIAFDWNGKEVRVEAEEVLFALGRIPNTEPLDLVQVGLETSQHTIITDERMQTSIPHIYAVGDCTGPYEIVHIAIQQGEVAGYNIAHQEAPKSIDYRLLINVVFTEPQVATVGLTEKVAMLHHIPYIAASYPFNDHGKSLVMEAKDGFVKLLADPKSGEILGGCCVGPSGGELIHEIVVAMAKRMTVKELAAIPHYHPTLAEIWTYPAEELADKIGA
jgi:pyruvate/2-oxoglutarate dehydrogenase complex dihydrolipoamide dehydrogenase (E3) component